MVILLVYKTHGLTLDYMSDKVFTDVMGRQVAASVAGVEFLSVVKDFKV